MQSMENRILGDYQIIKQIGQGSLGSVYLAEQRFLKKQYMLKILPEELATDRAFIKRFESEVASLTQINKQTQESYQLILDKYNAL